MNPMRRRMLAASGAMLAAAGAGAVMRPRALSADEVVDPQLDRLFPTACGTWRVDPLAGAFVRASDERGRVLGVYDRLLERTYIDPDGYRIMLSAAYVANAFDGPALQVHRPEICYRYAGYRVGPTEPVRVDAAGRAIPAVRLRADLPGRAEPITYWIVVGNTVADDHTELRWQRIRANLTRRVLDSLLVRVSSIDADEARAYRMQDGFAAAMAASLAPASAARIFGATAPAR